MADPWTSDLAALDRRARHQMRSIAATRASVLAKTASQESKMRLVKHHPVLAALAALLFLGVAAPAAYAAYTHFVVSIDTEQSPPEIEQSVKQQLDQAHVQADVHAAKGDDGTLQVRIQATDPGIASDVLRGGIQFALAGSAAIDLADAVTMQVVDHAQLTADQMQRLLAVFTSPEMIAADNQGGSAQELAAAAMRVLGAAGFHGCTVDVTGNAMTITVTAAPTDR